MSNPTIVLKHNQDESWTLRTEMAIKTFEITFKVGEIVEYEHFNGKQKVHFTRKDEKLT